MIIISDIRPLEVSSTYKKVSDLSNDYLLKFQKNYKPIDLLRKAINKRKRRRYTSSNKVELDILDYLVKNFDSILIQKPQDLHDTIIHFKTQAWQDLIYINGKTTKFGKELLEIFGYSKKFRSQVGRGIWLAKQLNIKSCPYCNAQYTILATGRRNRLIAKFQFDHFFSKDKYPYLSISLYNLIPSCANCNITKSKKPLSLKTHYNPYYLDFSIYFKFYLKYNPNPQKLTITQVKNENLEIILKPKNPINTAFVEEHNNLYHINGVYNRHQDIAEDLLIKAVIYTNHLQKAHLNIKGLFPDKSTYLRYLIGNFPDAKDILNRPLTKFMQDIAKQLKLIS